MMVILEIQDPNKVDLTGAEQHSFKTNKSLTSAALIVKSIIAV